MQGHILFSRRQVDYESCRDIAEGIQLIRLTEIKHIPNQPLFISYLPMELKMIKAKAVFSEPMPFDAHGILSPLEK